MVSDVPVGVLLSGGLDSSAVAALMTEVSEESVRSFSVSFAERSFDESPYARRVADHLHTEHHELRVTAAESRGGVAGDSVDGGRAVCRSLDHSDLSCQPVRP